MKAHQDVSILPPPFEWCCIPAVQRWQMNIEGEEKLVGTYDIHDFQMAKYLITYEQFKVFLNDPKGFKNEEWWQGLVVDMKRRSIPGTQEFSHSSNLPRENVNWYDAVAFCRWLSALTGYNICLPTEWEWQWAAQGIEGQAYPWGNNYIQGYANINEVASKIKCGIYLGKTSPVGSYLQGASPYGVLDMSGNLWEWCSNEYWFPEKVNYSGNNGRVVHGGSWYDGKLGSRVLVRTQSNPDRRSYDFGFRIILKEKQ